MFIELTLLVQSTDITSSIAHLKPSEPLPHEETDAVLGHGVILCGIAKAHYFTA
jgi:hypothetical protein